MMATQTVFPVEEVGPFVGDTLDTVRYRFCDYCYESAVEDVWANRPLRTFYLAQDDSGLSVCEHCLEKHFSGEEES